MVWIFVILMSQDMHYPYQEHMVMQKKVKDVLAYMIGIQNAESMLLGH